jgi:outer membrane receptor protein involved in Fe transport
VRYTDVHRYMSSLFFVSNIANPAQGEQIGNIPESIRSIREHKATPEVTLTYRPTDEITTFVSYKQGYKAPGFNFSTGATGYAAGVLKPFAGERANGVEGGVKAQLFDRSLNVSLAAYRYNYIGQQVSFVNNTSLVVETSNGANARVQGVELGVTYSPPTVPDLVLTGFINYNDAHYTSFPGAPCYGNQTVAQGCVGGVQNLAGQQLHRAPKWEGRVAMDYRKDLNDTYAVAGSLNINFASSYNAIPEKNPNGVQSAYATVDASVRFGQLDGPWELAVIGRNLTNEYILSGGLDGGVVPGGQTADALLYVYRPRQVMLQLTVRPEL